MSSKPALLATAILALLPAVAVGDIAGPDPIAIRLSRTPTALVGTVVSVEEKPVEALAYPGATEKVPFRVAVVKVEKGLLGTAGATHVRVGFLETQNPRRPIQKLAKDQQVLLFLKPHAQETFLVSNEYFYGFVYATDPTFKAQVEEAEKAAKALADPNKSLKSTDKDTRGLTAALLIHRYRTARGPIARVEPIPAEESKLILTALLDGNWSTAPTLNQVSALQAFLSLGLTPAEDWRVPGDFKEIAPAARKWLTDNAGTYRIQRLVTSEK
jgi:hypothetical protein